MKNKNTTETGKIKKAKKAVESLLAKGKIIVNREQIESMIPYSPDIIFLNRVSRAGDEYIGEFLVTEQVCGGGGHKIGGEYLVFRGADIMEMAAQFLGIIWGVQHPDFAKNKVVIFRKIKEMSFREFIFSGDVLKIKINSRDIKDRVLGGPEENNIVVSLIGKNFSLIVGKDEKATVESVKLIIGSPQILGLSKA